MLVLALLRRPSAFLPLVMSSAVLALILAHVARFGIAPQPDEGAAAHLFQTLMPAQVPIVAFFAITWLPRARRRALEVLSLQAGAALTVLAIVFFLHW
jgi:hypothetical protein